MKFLKIIVIFSFLIFFFGCAQQRQVVDGNIFYFSSSKAKSIEQLLNKSGSDIALDNHTGILYYKAGKKWLTTNAEVNRVELMSSIIGEVGQIIRTRGYYRSGDGGQASYKVVSRPPSDLIKMNAGFKLNNGKYAIRFIGEPINILSFGAKGDTDKSGNGTDDTQAFQNALDFISSMGGGQLSIPSKVDQFFKISTVYLKSGIRLTGEVSASSQEFKKLLGSKILVKNGGQGLVIGDNEYWPNKRVNGVVIEHLVVKGMKKSISGIRIGSDRSFITPCYVTIKNSLVEGFDNPNVNQVVYNKSTKEFGKEDNNFPGTHAVKGACGIFIAGVISASFENVVSQKNHYGLYESSGGFCTALNFSGGSYRHNTKNGMVFTTVKSASLNNLLVIETNGEEGLKLIAPKATNKNLKWGPGFFFIENIHLENNNFKRKSGYSIRIENENEDHFITNVSISNSRLDFNRYDGIFVAGGKGIKIYDNGILILPSKTQIYTNRCEDIKYDGKVIGKMKVDKQTQIFRKGQNELKRSSGNIAADYRSKKNTGDKAGSLLIQGDIAILADYLNSGKDAFTLKIWGRCLSDINKNSLKIRFNNQIILENTSITKTSGDTWFAEITISAGQSGFPNQAKTFSQLQIGNDFEPIKIVDIKERGLWEKTNRIYVFCQSGEVFLEGYQLSYESY